MSHGDIARRQFLRTSGGAISAVWIAAAMGELTAFSALSCAPAKQSSNWKSFTDAEAADVEAIAALIIPSDENPGAREAHVIDFIDRSLDTFAKEQRPLFATGLADLQRRVEAAKAGASSFAALDAAKHADRSTTASYDVTEATVLFGVAGAYYAAAGADELRPCPRAS